MRNNIIKKIVSVGMLSMVLVSGVLAGGIKAQASDVGFAVSTVIPENQTDKSKTYFDLQMKPGQEQILEVELKNGSDEEVYVEAEVHSATTNMNGVVEYGKRDAELDPSLRYNMQDFIELENSITIPPNSTYTLELEVKMPAEEFDGVLAGGITFQEAEKEDEESEGEDGIAIKNKYAYVVGIVFRETENDVIPELDLDRVFANQVNARNVISANIRNLMPMYMNKLEVEAEITKKDSTEVLYSEHKEEMQMAPNSNFDFPVSLNGERMKAGVYTINMTARSMGEEWTWSKDFTITEEEARAFNETDVTIPQQDYTWIIILAGVVAILLIVIIVLVVRSKKKAAKMRAEFETSMRGNDK